MRQDAKGVQNDIALNRWQLEEIAKGVMEADREDFARGEEVERTLSKWIQQTP